MFTAALFMLYLAPQRHFSVFALSFPGAEALATIYTSILSQHLRGEGFNAALQKSCPALVQLALALHQRISSTFLPTAVKFHYIFNLRDLSNIFQVTRREKMLQGGFIFIDVLLEERPRVNLFTIKCQKLNRKSCVVFHITPLSISDEARDILPRFTLFLRLRFPRVKSQAPVTNFSSKLLLI